MTKKEKADRKRERREMAEMIHETPAEYMARKYGIRGDADDGRTDEEDT